MKFLSNLLIIYNAIQDDIFGKGRIYSRFVTVIDSASFFKYIYSGLSVKVTKRDGDFGSNDVAPGRPAVQNSVFLACQWF